MIANTFDELYYDLVREVEGRGFAAGPRGKACLELRPYMFKVEDAQKALYTGGSRRLNYRFWAIEALAYLAGWGGPNGHAGHRHASLICRANPNAKFAMNAHSMMFTGAYGQYLRESYSDVSKLLTADPWTRQAVASIWSPGLPPRDPDIPCTCLLHFFMEPAYSISCSLNPASEGTRLAMAVYMRSNDLNWGTPYDVAAFAAIQCAMAASLGVPPGSYTHFAGSLHLYTAENNSGEKPPSILPPSYEEWQTDVVAEGVPIPRWARYSIDEVTTGAHVLLEELAAHVIDQGYKFTDFESKLEDQLYWKWWCLLIRRRWSHATEVAQLGLQEVANA